MGAQTTYDLKSPTAAVMGVWDKYDRALETLACRAVGEPYNFHRIDGELLPQMFGEGFFGKVLATCQKQFRKENRYSSHTVAAEMNLAPADVSALALRDSEIDLAFAFDLFRDIYGQFIEIQVADCVAGWVGQGKTGEEIRVLADQMRRDKGIRQRQTGSDGKEEFEAELLAALDGKVFDYPVKPHLSELRKLVPYFEPGDYIVITALSGIGKTYFAMNTVYHNAKNGVPCCYVNLENSPKNVMRRMWQMHSGAKFRRDMRGDETQINGHLRAWEEVKALPLRSHNPGPTLPAILATIRHEYNERGIGLALIDYAQLVSIPGYRGARNYELGEVSAAFRALALELKIPVMVLAQQKQEVAKTGDKRGGLYDIKDCANFAQDATFVMSLYRPFAVEVYDDPTGSPYSEDYADVTIVKGRETGRAFARCSFDPVRGFTDSVSNQFPVSAPAFSPALPQGAGRTEDVPF